MKYSIIQPPAELKEYVRYFWTLENHSPDADKTVFHTLVDDSSGIIIQQGNGRSAFTNHRGQNLPKVFLYGQSTMPTTTYTESQYEVTGVHFHPHAIRTLFGIDAHLLTDQNDDLDILQKNRLGRNLIHCASQEDRLSLLQQMLLQQVRQPLRQDHLVSHCLKTINKLKGDVQVNDLLRYERISKRQLERRFNTVVGIPPKLYIRVIRFREAVRLMKAKQFSRLSDIARELKYTDQAHFVRDIREFSGYTPGSIAQHVTEVLLNLHTRQ